MRKEIINKLRSSNLLNDNEINYLIKEMNKGKKYGLVWEDHPEDVELELKDGVFQIKELEDKRIEDNPKGRENLLLEGDNLHSLMALKEAGVKVDVIYIDPPYNTLNETGFRYNDKRIDLNDNYRHSKWLSFMHKRLELARDLMKDDGIIFVSIDDNELYNLKLLMDQVFGEGNFIENFIWLQASGNNNAKLSSNRHEYIVAFSKNKRELSGEFFNKRKTGINDVYDILNKNKQNSPNEIERKIRNYYKRNNITNGLANYNKVSDDKRIFRLSDLGNPAKNMHLNKDYNYELRNPKTGKVYTMPKRGWLYKKETMLEKIKDGFIYLDSDVPQLIRFLDDVIYENMPSYLYNTDLGSREIDLIIGKNMFDYPKPSSLISYYIKAHPNKNATVLDFFAGSGTTGQAVMDLNKEDGGNRRFILCTNNENNICEEVTYERNRRVITGEYAKEKVDPLPNNLSYYKVNILNKENVSFKEKERLDAAKNKYMTEWKEDVKIVEENEEYAIMKSSNKKVLFIKTGTISKETKKDIDLNKIDKVYMMKHLSRDKMFKGISENKMELF